MWGVCVTVLVACCSLTMFSAKWSIRHWFIHSRWRHKCTQLTFKEYDGLWTSTTATKAAQTCARTTSAAGSKAHRRLCARWPGHVWRQWPIRQRSQKWFIIHVIKEKWCIRQASRFRPGEFWCKEYIYKVVRWLTVWLLFYIDTEYILIICFDV